MKRLFPAPWLSLVLLALWLVLNLSISLGQVLLGALLAFLAPLLMSPLRPLTVKISRPGTILKLILRVGVDVVTSNLNVAVNVWRLGSKPPRSAFVEIPLDLRDAHGLAGLAIICSVIPGTVWSELALDRSILLMHVFDLEDEALFIEHFKLRYERPLQEIFE